MPSDYTPDFQYSPWTGLAYVFNLIVGTGALTLPAAFASAGWTLSLAVLLILSFMSFVTVTFMVESMSVANAMIKTKVDEERIGRRRNNTSRHNVRRERDPLIPHNLLDAPENFSASNFTASTVSVYEIEKSVEMGSMASMFFGQVGISIFYLCIAVYLYGDLAIYIAAVAKSIRDVACTHKVDNNSTNTNETFPVEDSDLCWTELDGIDRLGAYRLFTVVFMVVLGPFVFFNVSKTKYLQILTTIMRWIAFGVMISLAVARIASGEGTGNPVLANIHGIPNLFGVCVYSFMCHHSLPSLVTPINDKGRLLKMFSLDYLIITLFYLLLAFTGIFAFDNLKDLYTLNFEPDQSGSEQSSVLKLIVQYFLALFPVFTLSTNFPIIAITLRNNLKALFNLKDEYRQSNGRRSRSNLARFCAHVLCPLLAIFPPFLVAIFVENVQLLVGITGSYAGAAIQYFIPVFLVHCARKQSFAAADSVGDFNQNISPFKSSIWLYFVTGWAAVSIVFVTVNHFLSAHIF